MQIYRTTFIPLPCCLNTSMSCSNTWKWIHKNKSNLVKTKKWDGTAAQLNPHWTVSYTVAEFSRNSRYHSSKYLLLRSDISQAVGTTVLRGIFLTKMNFKPRRFLHTHPAKKWKWSLRTWSEKMIEYNRSHLFLKMSENEHDGSLWYRLRFLMHGALCLDIVAMLPGIGFFRHR